MDIPKMPLERRREHEYVGIGNNGPLHEVIISSVVFFSCFGAPRVST